MVISDAMSKEGGSVELRSILQEQAEGEIKALCLRSAGGLENIKEGLGNNGHIVTGIVCQMIFN